MKTEISSPLLTVNKSHHSCYALWMTEAVGEKEAWYRDYPTPSGPFATLWPLTRHEVSLMIHTQTQSDRRMDQLMLVYNDTHLIMLFPPFKIQLSPSIQNRIRFSTSGSILKKRQYDWVNFCAAIDIIEALTLGGGCWIWTPGAASYFPPLQIELRVSSLPGW